MGDVNGDITGGLDLAGFFGDVSGDDSGVFLGELSGEMIGVCVGLTLAVPLRICGGEGDFCEVGERDFCEVGVLGRDMLDTERTGLAAISTEPVLTASDSPRSLPWSCSTFRWSTFRSIVVSVIKVTSSTTFSRPVIPSRARFFRGLRCSASSLLGLLVVFASLMLRDTGGDFASAEDEDDSELSALVCRMVSSRSGSYRKVQSCHMTVGVDKRKRFTEHAMAKSWLSNQIYIIYPKGCSSNNPLSILNYQVHMTTMGGITSIANCALSLQLRL